MTVTVTVRGGCWYCPRLSMPRIVTVYVPAGITGDVYAKFDPGEPGLVRNVAIHGQLVGVPARPNVPAEFMPCPALLPICTSTFCIPPSSTARPVITIRPPVYACPSTGVMLGSSVGSVSPG